DWFADETPGKARVTVVAAEGAARIRVDDVLGVRKLGPHEDRLRFRLDNFHWSGRPARHAAHSGGTIDERLRWETAEPRAGVGKEGSANIGCQRFQLTL